MLHPDSLIQVGPSAIKRAEDVEIGDDVYVVGEGGHGGLATRAVEHVTRVETGVPLVTVTGRHRKITVTADTFLLMLRRDSPADGQPRAANWWTEWHKVSDLLVPAHGSRDPECGITKCWCPRHKRHFVVLDHLDEPADIAEPRSVGANQDAPHWHSPDSVEEARALRFQHIAMGHVVGFIREAPDGALLLDLAETNRRAEQVRTWGILPALPGPQFSIQRVFDLTVFDPQPTIVLDVEGDALIAEATVVSATGTMD